MKRLRDHGLVVGSLTPGSHNAITDVNGVSVGHLDVTEEDLQTGISCILPYPVEVTKRKLFIGRWALDSGAGMTGLGVAEDFGTFSTPIALAPAAAVGASYEAMIQLGLERDSGLSTLTGWPPIVVPVDDSHTNSPKRVYRQVREGALRRSIASAAGGVVREGNAGIGRGLSAFGYKGGVGTSSRLVPTAGSGHYTLGSLVAASGGQAHRLAVDGFPIHPWVGKLEAAPEGGCIVAVIATNAPLIPGQLDHLAGRASIGFARVGLLDAGTREGLVLAFSTASADQGQTRMVDGDLLRQLFQAAFEACEEAVLNALLAARSIRTRHGTLAQLPTNWVERTLLHQGEAE